MGSELIFRRSHALVAAENAQDLAYVLLTMIF